MRMKRRKVSRRMRMKRRRVSRKMMGFEISAAPRLSGLTRSCWPRICSETVLTDLIFAEQQQQLVLKQRKLGPLTATV